MTIHKNRFVVLAMLFLVGIGAYGGFTSRNNTIYTRASSDFSNNPTPITIQLDEEETQERTMDSPDGTKSLTMQIEKPKSKPHYTFFVSEKDGTSKNEIFTKKAIASEVLSIPYNTWSPDNVYFFLQDKTHLQDDYFVFMASGELFSGKAYISIQELFVDQVTGYTITDVTGWASPTLILVNTKEKEGDGKVSFWFDVPSQTFIQLGTYFH